MSRKSLSALSVDELLERAVEMDEMAATATNAAVKQSLEGLAARFRTFAARRASSAQLAERKPTAVGGDIL
jgi:hypothetical protein